MPFLTQFLLKSFIYLPILIIDRIKNHRRQQGANGGEIQRAYRRPLGSFRPRAGLTQQIN